MLDFARAMLAGWFTRMSGPLSVPAAALALWVDNTAAKYLFGITAFVCLWATAYLIWKVERDKNLELESVALKPRLQYRLFVTAEVEDQFISGGKKLDGRIIIENTSNEPLEYGPAVFSASFQNDNPKVINSGGQVLSPQKKVHYRFEFDERSMTKGDGSVIVIADIDYGPPGSRTGRLHKKIEVQYAVGDQGFITRSAATDREYQDISI